jgi:uncharacterized RDD family membrane protein YckC
MEIVEPNPYAPPESALASADSCAESPFTPVVAPVWRRLAAFVIDLVISLTVVLLVSRRFVVPLLVETAAGPTARRFPILAALIMIGVDLTSPTLVLLYFSVGECSGSGATIGKRLLKIRVARPDGSSIGPGRAIVRNLLKYFMNIVFGVGTLFAFLSPLRRTLHDRMADTLVIRRDADIRALDRHDCEHADQLISAPRALQ